MTPSTWRCRRPTVVLRESVVARLRDVPSAVRLISKEVGTR